jgi:Ca-activated chloride channel homolog
MVKSGLKVRFQLGSLRLARWKPLAAFWLVNIPRQLDLTVLPSYRTAAALQYFTMKQSLQLLFAGAALFGLYEGIAPGQSKTKDRDFSLVVDVSLVSVLATVTTPDGNWVAGLKQDDFQIYEDGKPQEIRVFGKESELPLQLCLLFDSSSSIATELRTQQEAAIQFLASIVRPVDRVSILRVSEDVDEVVRASSRMDRLSSAIRSIRPGGGTSLYDAIYLAADILGNAKGRKVIVAITDGTDTTSDLQIKDCLKQAQIAEAAIYGLVVQPIKSEPGRNLGGEHAMYYLAEKTGGRFFRVLSPDAIRNSFDKISEELRTQYYLGYYPQRAASTASEFRQIQVRVKDASYVVRTREGYFSRGR